MTKNAGRARARTARRSWRCWSCCAGSMRSGPADGKVCSELITVPFQPVPRPTRPTPSSYRAGPARICKLASTGGQSSGDGLFLGGQEGGFGFGGGPGDGADGGFEGQAADGGFQGRVVAAVALQFGGDLHQAAAAVQVVALHRVQHEVIAGQLADQQGADVRFVGGPGDGAEPVGGLDLAVPGGREPTDPLGDGAQGQVGGQDEGGGDGGGGDVPGAGQHADRGGAPDGGRGVDAPDVDAVAEDDPGAEEPD